MKSNRSVFHATAFALMALGSTTAAAQGAWKPFRCGNGDQGQIQFPYQGNALVQFRGEVVSLQQDPSGDARYYNGDWLLEIVGSARNISLEVPDYGQVGCYFLDQPQRPIFEPAQPIFQQPPNFGGGVTFPASAQSLGGNMRAGPGLNYRVVGNLPPGTPIEIYRQTDKYYQGFPWFEITYADRGAFMLGSLICSSGQQIQGTYQVCN